jgi:exodeoxyribonuclease-3
MKISTWNVNGIRAREAQVLDFLEIERPDVFCLQEIKASPEHVPQRLCERADYFCHWHGHKGYSGVGIYLRREVFGHAPSPSHPEFDAENRIVTVEAGDLVLASIYVPNGNKDYDAKVRFLEAMAGWVAGERARGKRLVLCGDLNVALADRDVHPKLRNPEQIGQTAPEQALLAGIIAAGGLVDLLRHFHADDDRLFTWWAPWRNLRERNIGWRLDYVLASEALAASATSCNAAREFGTSDHGPVTAVLENVAIDVPVSPEGQPVSASASTPPRAAGQLSLFSDER